MKNHTALCTSNFFHGSDNDASHASKQIGRGMRKRMPLSTSASAITRRSGVKRVEAIWFISSTETAPLVDSYLMAIHQQATVRQSVAGWHVSYNAHATYLTRWSIPKSDVGELRRRRCILSAMACTAAPLEALATPDRRVPNTFQSRERAKLAAKPAMGEVSFVCDPCVGGIALRCASSSSMARETQREGLSLFVLVDFARFVSTLHLHNISLSLLRMCDKERQEAACAFHSDVDKTESCEFRLSYAAAHVAFYTLLRHCEFGAFSRSAGTATHNHDAHHLQSLIYSEERLHTISTGRWRHVLNSVRMRGGVGLRSVEVVFSMRGRVACATLALHQWRVEEDDCLVHLLDADVRIVACPVFVGCRLKLLHSKSTNSFPTCSWISRVSLPDESDIVPEPFSLCLPTFDILPSSQEAQKECGGKRKLCAYEHSAKRVDAPRLLHVLCISKEVVSSSVGRGVHCEPGSALFERGIFLLRDSFGDKYAEEKARFLAACQNDMCMFLFQLGSENTFDGAVVMSMFRMVCTDACELDVALLIDSFAVLSSRQGNGYGGCMFRHVCHAIAKAACDGSYLIFSQCLDRRDARDFWRDKLDDTSEARSLFYHSSRSFPDLVLIHPNCTAKSRMHRVSG